MNQELEGVREAMGRVGSKDVRVFVKDAEELRREKYAAQQAAKSTAPAASGGTADKKKAGGDKPVDKPNAAPGGDKKPAAEKKSKGDNNNNNKAAPKEKETISHIDLRVGVVLSAEAHPDGDTLYVEKIDVGEKEPRTIVSGIREHVPLEKFIGSRVIVMCNLKEKPLRGVNSNGMICCASSTVGDKKTVRLLEISSTAKAGDRITWAGEPAGIQADPTPISGGKLGKLLKELRTDAEGNVVFGAESWKAQASGVDITCKEITNGVVG